MIVETLSSLETIALRALHRGADFLLAGPINLWLRGFNVKASPYLILISSRESAGPLKEAMSIGAESVEWEGYWFKVNGRNFRLRLRGVDLVGLADPEFRIGSSRIRFYAKSIARYSPVVGLGRGYVRLAPLLLEEHIAEVMGAEAYWRVEGRGRAARL